MSLPKGSDKELGSKGFVRDTLIQNYDKPKLLEDDAGLPLRRARLNGHRRPDELRIRLRLNLQEVELGSRSAEPPQGNAIDTRDHLRRLKRVEPIQPTVTLKLDTEAARWPRPNAAVVRLGLHEFQQHRRWWRPNLVVRRDNSSGVAQRR